MPDIDTSPAALRALADDKNPWSDGPIWPFKWLPVIRDVLRAIADEKEKAEAERDAARWQPIETAPRDGTTIWCYWPGIYGRQGVGWFVWDEFEEWTTPTVHYGYPTHWMPLPAAPANPEDPAHAE